MNRSETCFEGRFGKAGFAKAGLLTRKDFASNTSRFAKAGLLTRKDFHKRLGEVVWNLLTQGVGFFTRRMISVPYSENFLMKCHSGIRRVGSCCAMESL